MDLRDLTFNNLLIFPGETRLTDPNCPGSGVPTWLYRRVLLLMNENSVLPWPTVRDALTLQTGFRIPDDMMLAIRDQYVTLTGLQWADLRALPEIAFAPLPAHQMQPVPSIRAPLFPNHHIHPPPAAFPNSVLTQAALNHLGRFIADQQRHLPQIPQYYPPGQRFDPPLAGLAVNVNGPANGQQHPVHTVQNHPLDLLLRGFQPGGAPDGGNDHDSNATVTDPEYPGSDAGDYEPGQELDDGLQPQGPEEQQSPRYSPSQSPPPRNGADGTNSAIHAPRARRPQSSYQAVLNYSSGHSQNSSENGSVDSSPTVQVFRSVHTRVPTPGPGFAAPGIGMLRAKKTAASSPNANTATVTATVSGTAPGARTSGTRTGTGTGSTSRRPRARKTPRSPPRRNPLRSVRQTAAAPTPAPAPTTAPGSRPTGVTKSGRGANNQRRDRTPVLTTRVTRATTQAASAASAARAASAKKNKNQNKKKK